jgi:hypothetical protein
MFFGAILFHIWPRYSKPTYKLLPVLKEINTETKSECPEMFYQVIS